MGVIGDFIESVGDAISNGLDWIEDNVPVIGDIIGAFRYTPSYVGNLSEAVDFSNEISELKEKIREEYSDKEKEIMEMLSKGTNMLISELEKINKVKYGTKSLAINVDGIRQRCNELEKEVIGHIADECDKKFVITDPTIQKITKEYNAAKREKDFNEFANRVLCDAWASLKVKVDKTIKEQQDVIENEIKVRISEIDASMKEAESELNDILASKQKNEDMASKQIDQMYKHDLFVILEDLATSEN